MQGTPIQGSKLRLPGYLSGKGFHSGEDSGLITTAAARVRTQFAGECGALLSLMAFAVCSGDESPFPPQWEEITS